MTVASFQVLLVGWHDERWFVKVQGYSCLRLKKDFLAARGRVNAYGCRSDAAACGGISEVQNKIFRLQMRASDSDKSHEQHVIKPRDLCTRDRSHRIHLAAASWHTATQVKILFFQVLWAQFDIGLVVSQLASFVIRRGNG